MNKKLAFDEVVKLVGFIGEEERHFNSLELEYRKLASHWLLVALGAIGFVLSRENVLIIPPWILVISISISASCGIFVLWLLDLKVYHELLHSVFKEGLKLEKEYPAFLPQIRSNMIQSQSGGDIIRRVIYYYFFSILLLIAIANISIWMVIQSLLLNLIINFSCVILIYLLFKVMSYKSVGIFPMDNIKES